MAANTKNLKTDASGIKPFSQVYDPVLDDMDILTGASLGNNRYGSDTVSWGKTTGGVYVPIQVDANGVVQTALTGSNATKITSDGTSAGTSLESTFFPNNDAGNMTGVYGLNSNGFQMGFNGATWDRQRNNTQGPLLASAARTAGVITPTQTNYNSRGVIIFINVTVASGTGGIQPQIVAIDPISNTRMYYDSVPPVVTAIGEYAYILYTGSPTAQNQIKQAISAPLSRQWAVDVYHGDSSSYTYSMGYSLIN